MNTKVISVRVSEDFFNRVNKVADRLYPKSYTGQPNRTQLLMDALNLFCDLGEAGSFDEMNLSQIDTSQLIYSINNDRKDTLKQIQESVLRIEDKLNTNYVNIVNKNLNNINNEKENNLNNSFVNSVKKRKALKRDKNSFDETTIFSLQEAWEIAKEKGFMSNKESFRKRFDRRSDNPNFILHDFKRIENPEGRGYLYKLVKEPVKGCE